MSKTVVRSTAKKGEKEVTLHPAAESWNELVRRMEAVREQWVTHQETYLQHKGTIRDASLQTQKMLAGVFHRQTFFYGLDHLKKYANGGFMSLIIEE